MATIAPPIEIRSLHQFVEVVSEFSRDEDNCLFRGQERSSWVLRPTIGRLNLRQSTYLDTERRLLDAFKRCVIRGQNPRAFGSFESLVQVQAA